METIMSRLENVEKELDELKLSLKMEKELDELKLSKKAENLLKVGENDNVLIEKYKKSIKISGDTKIHKDFLKENKAKWNSTLKSWIVKPDEIGSIVDYFKEKLGDRVKVDI